MTLVALLAAGASWLSLAGGGRPVARSRPLATVPHATGSHAAAARPREARRGAAAQTARPEGSLAQTRAFPSATSARFRSSMASLWQGIVSGSLTPALAAFFPRDAYERLKAVASASSDWSGRLVHDYALDIAAAHALLGANAARARLLGVNVPSGYGHWVEPGVCYNDVGYYEVPNARIVYSEDGHVRSIGIASMISWRGMWYVVHLGAVLRSTGSGEVDQPASGPGQSTYSGTC
jgi:hypothetical protein